MENPLQVLVVDDEASVCRGVKRILMRAGMGVATAMTEMDAVAAAERASYDAIIVDLHLGRDMGTRTIAKLARIRAESVFLLTTAGNQRAIPRSEADDIVTALLPKPITAAAIIDAVRSERVLEADDVVTALVVAPENEQVACVAAIERSFARVRIACESTLHGARETMTRERFDLCMLSPALRDARGIHALHGVRSELRTGAMVVVARGEQDVRVERFLRHGADDVICTADLTGRVAERALRLTLERRRARETVLATHQRDSLTGLLTRAGLSSRYAVAHEWARRGRRALGLVYLDLDRFKAINDVHGHHAGDAVLEEVARRLRLCLRGGDVVARLGGDEFAILVDNLDNRAQLDALVARLHAAVVAPILFEGHSLHVGVSSGTAMFPNDAAELDALLQLADRKMYVHKRKHAAA